MKIFQVCGDTGVVPDGTRGSSVHLRSLAAALSNRGHEVTSFTARGPGGVGNFPVALHRLESVSSLMREVHRSGAPDFIYERYALSHEASLLSPAEGRDPATKTSGIGLKAARLVGCPFVLEVNAQLLREAEVHRGLTPRPEHRRAEQILFREADLVVTVSEPLRRYVEDVRGTPRGVVVVHNGCDPAMFPTPARPHEQDDLLVFLGDPRPWHGAEALPSLIKDLARLGRPARLMVLGGGKGAERVFDAALAEHVEDRVEITGPLPQPEATERLVQCSVAVAPYTLDPLFYFCPLKLIEYMAAGLPIVTTAQGDIPTILGPTGVMVPAGDSEAFLHAVKRLIDDPRLRADLGREARVRALTRFTWDHSAAKLERCVRPVL